jgi:MFS family permease
VKPSVLRLPVPAAVRGLPREFWILWIGTLIDRAGSFVLPFLAIYLTESVGLSPARAGLIVALHGLSGVFSGPAGGALADRLGRRRTIVLGLVASASAMLLLGTVRAAPLIAPAVACLGFTAPLARPAVQAMIADVVPSVDRPRAYGGLFWAANLGFAIAPMVAGLLAGRAFFWLFVGDAATTLIYAGIVVTLLGETRPTAGGTATNLSGLWVAFHNGTLLVFLALTVAFCTILLQCWSTLPLDLRAHGVTPAQYGALISLNGVVIFLVQPWLSLWARRFSRSRVLAAGTFIVGAGYALNALVTSRVGYGAAIVVWTLGEIPVAAVAPSIVADLAPADQRGRYQGAYSMAWGLAGFAAPALGGLVLDRAGARVLWLASGAVGALVAVGHLAAAPARRRALEALRRTAP